MQSRCSPYLAAHCLESEDEDRVPWMGKRLATTGVGYKLQSPHGVCWMPASQANDVAFLRGQPLPDQTADDEFWILGGRLLFKITYTYTHTFRQRMTKILGRHHHARICQIASHTHDLSQPFQCLTTVRQNQGPKASPATS